MLRLKSDCCRGTAPYRLVALAEISACHVGENGVRNFESQLEFRYCSAFLVKK